MKRIAWAGLLAAMALLAGCGQMGPLYFDEAPPADQLPPSRGGERAAVASAPADAATDVKDDEGQGRDPLPAFESSEGAAPPTGTR